VIVVVAVEIRYVQRIKTLTMMQMIGLGRGTLNLIDVVVLASFPAENQRY
jgi:hypothetical protein